MNHIDCVYLWKHYHPTPRPKQSKPIPQQFYRSIVTLTLTMTVFISLTHCPDHDMGNLSCRRKKRKKTDFLCLISSLKYIRPTQFLLLYHITLDEECGQALFIRKLEQYSWHWGLAICSQTSTIRFQWKFQWKTQNRQTLSVFNGILPGLGRVYVSDLDLD